MLDRRRKLLIVLAAYAVTGLIVFSVFLQPPPSVTATPKRIDRMPAAVDGWIGEDMPRDETRRFFLLKDDSPFAALVRTYRHPQYGRRVILNALEDLSGYQRDIHDPRFCYESRGWTVLSFENHAVEWSAGKKAVLKRVAYASSLQAARRVELYAYMVDDKVIVSDFDLLKTRLLQRIKGLTRTAQPHILYIGISTEIEGDLDAQAVETLEHFAGDVLKAVLD